LIPALNAEGRDTEEKNREVKAGGVPEGRNGIAIGGKLTSAYIFCENLRRTAV
jgi:hypothetical protein